MCLALEADGPAIWRASRGPRGRVPPMAVLYVASDQANLGSPSGPRHGCNNEDSIRQPDSSPPHDGHDGKCKQDFMNKMRQLRAAPLNGNEVLDRVL